MRATNVDTEERRVRESGSEPGSMSHFWILLDTLPHSSSLRSKSRILAWREFPEIPPFLQETQIESLICWARNLKGIGNRFFDTFLQFSAFSPTEFFDEHSHRPNSGGQKLVVFERNFWDFNGAQ